MDRQFQYRLSVTIHAGLNDAQLTIRQREQIAATTRRLADSLKRGDRSFCFEWFYGACGLDPWGDLLEPEPR